MNEGFEVLAAQCRSDAFRQSLAHSADVWLHMESALDDALTALKQHIVVVSNGSNEGQESGVANTSSGDGANGVDEDNDDGLGYTIRVSRAQAQNGLDTGEFTPTSVEVRDAAKVAKHVAIATSAFRLLRNACATCKANQAACRATRVVQQVGSTFPCTLVTVGLQIVTSFFSDDVIVGARDCDRLLSIVLLSQVALQFLVNCVAGNEQNQAIVWEMFFPDHFQKVLVECQEHRKIVAFAVALVLNCVNSQQASMLEEVTQRRMDLVCARNLVITVLQRCLVKPASNSAGSFSAPAILPLPTNHDNHDPAFEWICLLFRVLFEAGYTKDLYNAVGAHMLSKLWSRVTPEQLILLRMMTLWVTSHFESGRQKPSNRQEAVAAAHISGAVASLELFEFLKNTWVYVITRDDDDRPEEAEEARKLMWIELEKEAKLLLLDSIGEVAQFASLIRTEQAQLLLESLLEELQRVWQLRRLGMKGGAQATNTSGSASSESDAEPFGYRSGIIRAVGNLSFRHSEHQDMVRERGHLELFLNHCNIDDANPLVREWSLVALRNLCEGNEANQQYINALKPQQQPAPGQSAAFDGQAESIDEDGKNAQ